VGTHTKHLVEDTEGFGSIHYAFGSKPYGVYDQPNVLVNVSFDPWLQPLTEMLSIIMGDG
jgi:hypothetical protein